MIESNDGLVAELKRYAASTSCVDDVVTTDGFSLMDLLPAMFIVKTGFNDTLKGNDPGGPLCALFCVSY